MSDLLLPDHWHLWAVAAVMGLIALNYLTQFVRPALRLHTRLSQVNAHLTWLSQKPPGTAIDLTQLKDEVMTSPTLQHAWQQYASTLQVQRLAPDSGPLGAARQRVSQLSKAFFAHLDVAANGGRLDLSNIEQLAHNDPHLAPLWAEYTQAIEALQPLEMSAHLATGPWQASSHAENYFTEQALVDSPLRSNFYKHIPGILTGVGIIGTFTGLITALVGFDVSQPDRVQAELSQLVQTVGHAFLVSALAITLAMVFTWIEKALLTSRYRQVEELQQRLDALFTPQGGVPYLERLTLATEMQTALSYQILAELRASAPGGRQR
jgi:MotA/TolQ/ExbB proton channel family